MSRNSLLYHNVVLNLHNLIVTRSTSTAELNTSRNILNHAKCNFELLMRLYYLRHGYGCSDTYITHTLVTLAFAALNQQASEPSTLPQQALDDLRSTVFLAAQGLAEQGKHYHISRTLFELITHQMNGGDVSTLLSLLGTQGIEVGSKLSSAKHMQAEYPINIVDMAEHPEQRRLGNMIEEYSRQARDAQLPQASSSEGSG